jgi:hypothetical protein
MILTTLLGHRLGVELRDLIGRRRAKWHNTASLGQGQAFAQAMQPYPHPLDLGFDRGDGVNPLKTVARAELRGPSFPGEFHIAPK